MATNLPTDVDATYPDRDPGDATHQQHHDQLHAYTNTHDTAPDPHGDRAYADSLFAGVAAPVDEGFRAYRVSTQALSSAVHTTIIFDTEVRDQGSDYNPATGEWTVPADGWYDVAAFVQFSTPAVGERYIVNIRVNGADNARVADSAAASTSSLVAGGALPMYRVAGEVVTVAAWRANAGTVGAGPAYTFFTAKRRT